MRQIIFDANVIIMQLEHELVAVRNARCKKSISPLDARALNVRTLGLPKRIYQTKPLAQCEASYRFGFAPVIFQRARKRSVTVRQKPESLLARNGQEQKKVQEKTGAIKCLRFKAPFCVRKHSSYFLLYFCRIGLRRSSNSLAAFSSAAEGWRCGLVGAPGDLCGFVTAAVFCGFVILPGCRCGLVNCIVLFDSPFAWAAGSSEAIA